MPSYKVKLEICGSAYVVSTNDPAEYLEALAERLDADMKQVMQTAANSSVVSAAIITALGYLDEETKTRQAADNMRAQIQDYLEDAAKAKLAAEEARREAERLRRELAFYERKEKGEQAPPVEVPVQQPRPPAAPAPRFITDEDETAQLGMEDL
ncbi:MAG: cell division protein ZapA [Oscillospiraceae bacterium]